MIYDLVIAPTWMNFIMICIILNFGVLAAEHENMSPKFESLLEDCNLALIIIFTVEIVFNVTGFGIHYYLRDAFNFVDGLIVVFRYVIRIFKLKCYRF